MQGTTFRFIWPLWAGAGLALAACRSNSANAGAASLPRKPSSIETKLAQYTSVRLGARLDRLTENERKMIPLLIDAARAMDAIFWRQAYGNRDSLLEHLDDPATRRYAEINYGPWDRLDNNSSFVEGVGPKPAGAGFYPRDMTKEELEAAAKKSPARPRPSRTSIPSSGGIPPETS
jgi:hypothetical protein